MNHLALSKALLFLFDPTQHAKFRKACQGQSEDPQLGDHGWSHQQHQVLSEVAARIRTHTGWPQDEKYDVPLIIVVTKFDAWCSLMGVSKLRLRELIRPVGENLSALHIDGIQSASAKVRKVLRQYSPEIVSAAEGFSRDVIYIPVSALGNSPEIDPETGRLGIRPADVEPMWAEVPLLYALHRTTGRLIYGAERKMSAFNSDAVGAQGFDKAADVSDGIGSR